MTYRVHSPVDALLEAVKAANAVVVAEGSALDVACDHKVEWGVVRGVRVFNLQIVTSNSGVEADSALLGALLELAVKLVLFIFELRRTIVVL